RDGAAEHRRTAVAGGDQQAQRERGEDRGGEGEVLPALRGGQAGEALDRRGFVAHKGREGGGDLGGVVRGERELPAGRGRVGPVQPGDGRVGGGLRPAFLLREGEGEVVARGPVCRGFLNTFVPAGTGGLEVAGAVGGAGFVGERGSRKNDGGEEQGEEREPGEEVAPAKELAGGKAGRGTRGERAAGLLDPVGRKRGVGAVEHAFGFGPERGPGRIGEVARGGRGPGESP